MPNRPADIARYTYIQIAMMVVGFINTLIHWDATVALPGNSSTQQILSLVFGYGIGLALLYFIYMRASNVARWISVVFTVLGTLFIIPIFMMDIPVPGGAMLPIISALVSLGALWFLFTPAAKNWFAKNPDHTVFK